VKNLATLAETIDIYGWNPGDSGWWYLYASISYRG
jgi:hypothetical protein